MDEISDSDGLTHLETQMRRSDPRDRAHGRLCLVCDDKLQPGERKVHAGDCARIRKVTLRRTSRARRRGSK